MKLVKMLVLIAVVALFVPQLASAADTKNSVGVFVGYLSPTGDVALNENVVVGKLELDSAMGFGLAYQYKFTDMFSLGASLLYSSHDVKFTGTIDTVPANGKFGETTFMPILFDGNFHFLKNAKSVDLYAGPTLGFATWGDLKTKGSFSDLGSFGVKSNLVYGANLGVDVPFGSNWAFNGGLRYLLAKAEIDESGAPKIDVNPIIVTVGVSYKF